MHRVFIVRGLVAAVLLIGLLAWILFGGALN